VSIKSSNRNILLKYNQQDATFSRSIYFYKLLYMFQAVPLPVVPPPVIRSTKRYIQRQVLSNQYCCYHGWDGTTFHLIHDSSRQLLHPSSGAQNGTYSVRYCQTNTIMDEMKLHSISSTIAASSSIGLTIHDAVCTVLCSWWWAEEPPETYRAIYRNK
jgi:hypothetical protein